MSIAPTVEVPSWVGSRAAAWNQLISGSSGELSLGSSSGGQIFNFSGMTAASVVQKLGRIQAADALVPSTDRPIVATQIDAPGPTGPNSGLSPLIDAMISPDPGPTTPSPKSLEDMYKPPETKPAPAPVTPQAAVPAGNPLEQEPVQVPTGPQQQQQPSGPSTSLLDMPNTDGRPEGSTWDGQMLDGRPVKYIIPKGNGSNTVDLEITNPNGTIDRWRIASDGHGGLQHWHDDANGDSSYASRTDPNSRWYIQSFNPGTSTSGAPSHDLEATATFSHVFTPSYDANGNRVGTDVGILNKFGLYDNNHVDNYGNLTMTTARPDGKGGVISEFGKQLDSNSWRFGTDGQIWEMGTDLRGHTTYGRTALDDGGSHSLLISDGVLYDSFYGRNGGLGSHTDQYNSDGTITRTIPNGPKLLLRPDGSHTVLREAPGGYDSMTKALMTGVGVLKSMGTSLKNWGSDLISTFDFRPGLLAVGNPTNPAYQAAAAEHFQRSNAAIQAPFYLLIIDPAATVGKAVYYKYTGAMLGLTGDPITPGGRIRAQQGIDQMNKAPSDIETLLAASAFFFPESAAARAGATTAVHGAELALTDLAAATARKSLPELARSTMWSGTNAFKFGLNSATTLIRTGSEVALRSGIGTTMFVGRTAVGSASRVGEFVSDMSAAVLRNSATLQSRLRPVSEFVFDASLTTAIKARSIFDRATRIPGLVPIPAGGRLSDAFRSPPRVFNFSAPRSGGPLRRQGMELPGYRTPAEMNGPARQLKASEFDQLVNPFDASNRRVLPKLVPNAKYEFSVGGNKTVIITNLEGAPRYIETWASVKGVNGQPVYNELLEHAFPNAVYKINGKFMLRSDEYARIAEAYSRDMKIVPHPRLRDRGKQAEFNLRKGAISGASTDAGHLFRDEWGSPAELIFYTPQRSKVNQFGGTYFKIEGKISTLIRRASKQSPPRDVEYNVLVEYGSNPRSPGFRVDGDDFTPAAYNVGYKRTTEAGWRESRIVN